MTGGKLLSVGVAGTVLAAICCATPALAILLGVLGLSAWLAWSDYVVLPAVLVFLGIAMYGLARWRHPAADACCDTPTPTTKKG